MAAALLIAEPEPGVRGQLERSLAGDGFEIVVAGGPGEALDAVERKRPDVVLASEVELVRRLRAGEPGRTWDRRVPAIVIGAQAGDPLVRVKALERGADDYLGRPFHHEELVARIHALLRRVAPPDDERARRVGEIAIDREARLVHVGGLPLVLPAKEFGLLWMLCGEPERIFTKAELLREVWGYRSAGRTRTLDSHASRLRLKLARLSGTRYVVNVWGVGYRLTSPV